MRFFPVVERMRVVDANGNLVSWNTLILSICFQMVVNVVLIILYCIGDANGKTMLAYVANAQGISGV